jgi:hypothetical protein
MALHLRASSVYAAGRLATVGVLLGLALGSPAAPAAAQTVGCAAFQQLGVVDLGRDTDGDGVSDFLECRGGNTLAQLRPGVTVNGQAVIDTCQGTGLPRAACLDPNTPDIFVILVPDTLNGSRIPANPFQVLTRPVANGGLGLAVHPLVDGRGPGSDRSVLLGSAVKAPRCTEDNSLATSQVIGQANWGTPGGLDECVVRLLAVENYVRSRFTENKFPDPGPNCGPCEALKVQVINHELGHMIQLRFLYDARFGGHHYKTGSGFLHDQATTYRVTRSGITFSIPTVVSGADQGDFGLTP